MTKITGRISSDAPLIRTIISGAGPKGQSVEYVWDGTRLGLKMEGDEEFVFVDLKGDSIELQVNAEYIQWKNSTDTEWQNLIPLADLKGEKGDTGEVDYTYVDSQDALKADKTYVDSKVQTDVPSGAKFTDTITTINGKTGTITKADITALGIPAQDTVVDISGKADTTYVDGKVKTDVPVGAKFTDTIYTHPASHPASMITGLPTSLPASGGNADTVGGFTVGVNVPAGAVFTDTDTVTSINGKTGVIEKADIVALGIPAQDTNTTYTAGTNIAITGNTISATDTVVDVSGKADKTYVDNKVKTDVPENAKFTDTVIDIADNLTTNDATKALSAKQGKILNEKSPNKEYYQPHPTKTNHNTGNAEGYNTTASGYYSHAEGYNTTANGPYSHAEGIDTTASGFYSHAEGIDTTASGRYSHAEGYRTTASGETSHAQNDNTIAQGKAQTAIGKYNIPQGLYDWITPYDHAFIIGNGTEDNRSNALAVNWKGDLDIAGDYKINGNVMVEPTITTAWEKFEIETITASVAMSAPMGGGINLNVSAGGVFDWAVGDKIISASIVTDGAGTISPELENPLTIANFEEMGFNVTGTNASLYPVGDDFMPLIIGNTTHPQLGKIGAFATYGVDGTSVTVEVLRNPTVVYSDDADAYPDSGQVGDYYYIKMSPVRGLEYRIKLLEDSVGDISSVLDAINGEVI